jgi:hypothetical protein
MVASAEVKDHLITLLARWCSARGMPPIAGASMRCPLWTLDARAHPAPDNPSLTIGIPVEQGHAHSSKRRIDVSAMRPSTMLVLWSVTI